MKIGLLIALAFYWLISFAFFSVSGSAFGVSNDYGIESNFSISDVENGINATSLSEEDLDAGGFFSVGISFSRFLSFSTFGISADSSSPSWFLLIFSLWQIAIIILSVAFVISSVWNG